MPAKTRIPIGARFGRLTVLGESPQRSSTFVTWGCRCDCGMIVLVAGVNLRNGHTLSCGCLLAERNREIRTTHGLAASIPEYKTWLSMRGRCLNPNNRQYPNYAGRGIRICPEWDDFAVFYRDMGPKPTPVHSIDRIDNDGPYSPGNCRWATPTQQARNRRITRTLTFQGETRPIGEWAEIIGVSYDRLYSRLEEGWTAERALTEPFRTMGGTSTDSP